MAVTSSTKCFTHIKQRKDPVKPVTFTIVYVCVYVCVLKNPLLY